MADGLPNLQPGGLLAYLTDGLDDLSPLVNGVAPAGGPPALTQNQLPYESQQLWGAGGTDVGAGQDCEEEEEEDDAGPALATAKNSKKRKREPNYSMEEMTTIIRLRCARLAAPHAQRAERQGVRAVQRPAAGHEEGLSGPKTARAYWARKCLRGCYGPISYRAVLKRA
jgi:hypothetical protein